MKWTTHVCVQLKPADNELNHKKQTKYENEKKESNFPLFY